MSTDLENFPTSESAKRMIGNVSPIYENSYVGKWLFEVMGLEMDEARSIIESLRQQCFIDQCTWAIRYWEQAYGITPDESLDIESRRKAVRIKMARMTSVTPASLENILAAMTGRTITVTELNSEYMFDIAVESGTEKVDYNAVIEKVNTIKPSHLGYTITLPRKGSLTIYFGIATYIEKNVVLTSFDDTGISNIRALADEDGNYLVDENGNILVDAPDDYES